MTEPPAQDHPKHCPSREILKDFTTGRLPPVASEAIAKHIECCRRCTESLLALENDFDPLIEQLQDIHQKLPPELDESENVSARIEESILMPLPNDGEEPLPEATASPLKSDSDASLVCPHCKLPQEEKAPPQASRLDCSSCGKAFLYLSDSERTTRKTTVSHFEILECLGQGSYGIVWKAKDLLLDRLVALKVPRIRSDNQKELFIREGRMAARLRHPNIVPVYEVGSEDDIVFLASEYVEGRTLKDLLDQERPSFESSTRWVIALANALALAHSEGVIHRDLTPSNILIDQAGHPHITDFGIAKNRLPEIAFSTEGKVIGTPGYMSPEQAHGISDAHDPRSDLFSLGVILFELLTGTAPFRGNLPTLVQQILFVDPPSPSRYDPHIPDRLQAVCLKCMEKRPDNRYRSADQVAEALEEFLRDGCAEKSPDRAAAKRRRAPLAMAGFLLLALLLPLGAMLLTNRPWRDSPSGVSEAERREAKIVPAKVIPHISKTSLEVSSLGMMEVSERGIASMTFSPDGEILATVGPVSSCKWWDGRTGTLKKTLRPSSDGFRGEISFSHRGDLFAAGGFQEAVLFDRSSGEIVEVFSDFNSGVYRTAFSHNDRYLLVKPIHAEPSLWSVEKGTPEARFDNLPTRSRGLSLSPDDRHLLSHYGNRIDIWSTSDGKHILALEHPAEVHQAVFHPRGDLVLASTAGGRLVIWEWETKNALVRHDFEKESAGEIAFHPRVEKYGVGFADGSFMIGFSRRAEIVLTAKAHAGKIHQVCFSPNGRLAATASEDRTVALWEMNRKEPSVTLQGHGEGVMHLVFSPDGSRLVTGSADGIARLWEIEWNE